MLRSGAWRQRSRAFGSFSAMSACFPDPTQNKKGFVHVIRKVVCLQGESFSAWGRVPCAGPLGSAILGGLKNWPPPPPSPVQPIRGQEGSW